MASMCAAIRHAIANPMEKSPQRRELVKRLLYNPGRGTVVAADTLERLLAERNEDSNTHGREENVIAGIANGMLHG